VTQEAEQAEVVLGAPDGVTQETEQAEVVETKTVIAKSDRILFKHPSISIVPGDWTEACEVKNLHPGYKDKTLKTKKTGDLRVLPGKGPRAWHEKSKGDDIQTWTGRSWKKICNKCFAENAVTTANYRDGNKLPACARHAREDGTHVVRNMCVKCLETTRTEIYSMFKDANGRWACAKHARQDETYVQRAGRGEGSEDE
jgi:hypothetical protein